MVDQIPRMHELASQSVARAPYMRARAKATVTFW